MSAGARADAVVVLAGRPERKVYGLELWRTGAAPALILSVARFEWRAFPTLGLPDDGGLAALVAQTPPRLRHFLVTLNEHGAQATWMPRGRLGTWSEALGVSRLARSRGWTSLLVVTTEAHLARTRLAFGRALHGSGVALALEPVPDERSSVRRSRWWKDRWALRVVIGEWIKLPAYWLFARGGWEAPPAPRS